jgi:hypothetical protein
MMEGSLQFLYVVGHKFLTHVLASFSCLGSLQRLCLTSCTFLATLPDTFGNLSSLQ